MFRLWASVSPSVKGEGQWRWPQRSLCPDGKPSVGIWSTLFRESPNLPQAASVSHSAWFCFHEAKPTSWVTQKPGARPGWGGSAELKQGDELRVGYLGRTCRVLVTSSVYKGERVGGLQAPPHRPLDILTLQRGPEQGLLKSKAQGRGLSYPVLTQGLMCLRAGIQLLVSPPPNLVLGLTDPPSGASESPRKEEGTFPFVS